MGAGVVGLACAVEVARSGRRVVVVEKNVAPGQETSARNSQVIHAGLYYPRGSLKALCCVEGRELLYARCARLGIPHRAIGKLVVATCDAEVETLEEIGRRAEENGAPVQWRDRNEVARLEPAVRAVAALWSPRTGIVDAHALVQSYRAELDSLGGVVALRTRVVELERRAASWGVSTVGQAGESFSFEVPVVVNAAGLASDRIAELAGVDVDACGWRLRFCKGDYFGLEPGRATPTHHLVYPVPAGGGLGAHVTIDLGGRVRFGPDAEYVEEPSYRVDPAKRGRFAEAVRRYLPEIVAADLHPEMAGVRPKLSGPGEAVADFVVAESSAVGAPGMVQLIGIESPGLTASPAIARRVAALVRSCFDA